MLVELHCHTNHSDGLASPRQVIKKAEKELGGIAITDHNTFSGYLAAKKMKPKCILIPGIEVTCRNKNTSAHVIALGIQELKAKACTLDELIDETHSVGGLAINAHPFGGFSRNGFSDIKSARKFDAIEVLNGNTLPSGNKKSAALAARLKKPATAGSDAHVLGDVGKFACIIKADDADGILKCIKKGKVILPDKQTSTIPLLSAKVRRRIIRKLNLLGG